jgi:hypothetical protein
MPPAGVPVRNLIEPSFRTVSGSVRGRWLAPASGVRPRSPRSTSSEAEAFWTRLAASPPSAPTSRDRGGFGAGTVTALARGPAGMCQAGRWERSAGQARGRHPASLPAAIGGRSACTQADPTVGRGIVSWVDILGHGRYYLHGPDHGLPPAYLVHSTPETGPVETSVLFRNQRAGAVDIYWITPGGDPKHYGTLPTNQERSFTTYMGHRWVIRDRQTNTDVASVTGTREAQVVTLTGP